MRLALSNQGKNNNKRGTTFRKNTKPALRKSMAYKQKSNFTVQVGPNIPTLILVGELDDWTPASDCERALAHWGIAGVPVQLVTYRGAHHAFDVEIFQPGRMMFGHWTEYNAKAAEDARRRIYAFLTEYFEK
jgi:dienelactone hydrolase